MKILLILLAGFFLGLISARFYFSAPEATPVSTVAVSVERTNAPAPVTAAPASEQFSATKLEGSPAVITAPAAVPVSAEKRRFLDDLTEDDIDLWRKIRSEKISDFLKNNSEYWHAGRDSSKTGQPGRLDLNVLRASLGKYECKITYEIHETKVRSTYKFILDLTGAGHDAKNALSMEGGDGESKDSMSADFTWEYLGTDGREVNVVWYNSNGNQDRYVSNFAFKLRSGMALGEKMSTRLVGLGPTLSWFEIGSVEIKKIR